MARQNQFTVNAESVQGNPGAEVTFSRIKMREWREWRDDPSTTDGDLIREHVVSWCGFVDGADAELPSPADEPDVLGELYMGEQRALVLLLLAGPDGEHAKN